MDEQNLKPLIGLTLPELREVAAEAGLKPFAAKQMAAWLYERRATSIDEMTDLSKAGRERLKEKYTVGLTAPKAEARSNDGIVLQ